MNPEHVTLDDGTRMLIRAVEPADKELLTGGFLSLSRESRYQRFFSPKHRLSAEELRFYTEVDGVSHFAVAAGVTDDDDIPIEGVGVARYVGIGPGVAEMSIVVADGFQRRGIGKRLLLHLMSEGRRNEIERFVAQLLRTNGAALQLIASVAGSYKEEFAGTYRVVTFDL
ncbi:MAG: GNAT family N-acetyltransferase [Planctomycetota bacterium]|jgi:GNAT superfamily N-acetyltransferase